MAYFYPSRTVQGPVSSSGCEIRNTAGVVIASTTNGFMAAAIVDLINFGLPIAAEIEAQHDAREASALSLLLRRPVTTA